VKRVAIIGAGPIGIAAGIGALDRGFDVTLIEKGDAGQALCSWGATRFFTPLRMNITPRMHELLGRDAPPGDALLTGHEMIDLVLKPLTACEPLRGHVRERTRVTAIGRRGLTRADYAGHPLRAERPFRLILNDEEPIEADVVLDATGGFAVPNPIGAGGLPARGEGKLTRKPIRTLGALDEQLESLRGQRVLLVGDGHSAANAVLLLHETAEVIWVVRSMNRRPCEEIANDPLSERARVVSAANDLAENALHVERRCMVEAFDERNGAIEARLTSGRTLICDAVVALTGFHPNGNMHSELNVETSPVTEGAARLSRAIANATDCLAVPRVTFGDLASGEPNFWFIGSRSYGRVRTFLLQTGLAQLEMIFQCL
jgi:thioredoxin reductase